MKRFIFWLKNRITGKADCSGWCVGCPYYESCRNDIEYDEY